MKQNIIVFNFVLHNMVSVECHYLWSVTVTGLWPLTAS